eukprot:scaffold7039_cov118-Isochrysis_galbana.AAC.8
MSDDFWKESSISCRFSTPRYLRGVGFGRSEYGLCIVRRRCSGSQPIALAMRAVTWSYDQRLSMVISIARSFSRTPCPWLCCGGSRCTCTTTRFFTCSKNCGILSSGSCSSTSVAPVDVSTAMLVGMAAPALSAHW